jgi:hypothetical protein
VAWHVQAELGLHGGGHVDLGEDAEALLGQGRASAFDSLGIADFKSGADGVPGHGIPFR